MRQQQKARNVEKPKVIQLYVKFGLFLDWINENSYLLINQKKECWIDGQGEYYENFKYVQ